jgi:hypothetical protein
MSLSFSFDYFDVSHHENENDNEHENNTAIYPNKMGQEIHPIVAYGSVERLP